MDYKEFKVKKRKNANAYKPFMIIITIIYRLLVLCYSFVKDIYNSSILYIVIIIITLCNNISNNISNSIEKLREVVIQINKQLHNNILSGNFDGEYNGRCGVEEKRVFSCDSPKNYVDRDNLFNEIVWDRAEEDLDLQDIVIIPSGDFIPFQKPATPAMEGIIDLHHDIFFFLIFIFAIVGCVLITIVDRFWMASYKDMRSFYYHRDHIIQFFYLGDNILIEESYARNFNEDEDMETDPIEKQINGSCPDLIFYGAVSRASNIGTNFLIEFIWTIVPALILLIIVIPSFALLYGMDELAKGYLTVKVIGHQWYWSYEISDRMVFSERYTTYKRIITTNSILVKTGELLTLVPGLVGHEKKEIQLSDVFLVFREILRSPIIKVLKFDSYMLPVEDLICGQHRLYLSVTKALVVPLQVTIRILVTSVDVLHSWALPSLGIKLDASPGRLNQTCLYLKRHGSFYGQCSELCGVNHAFMPIHVKGVRLYAFLRYLQNYYIENYYLYKFKQALVCSYFEFLEK